MGNNYSQLKRSLFCGFPQHSVLKKLEGKYEAAEPLYLQALRIFLESLGESHPNTLTVWRNYLIFWWQLIEENPANLEKLKNHPFGEAIAAAITG